MFEYEQPPAEEKQPTDYTGLIIGFMLVPVFVLVTYLRDADTALAACVVLGVTMLAVKLRWHLRNHFWFRAIIVLILALQSPLIFVVRRPQGSVPTLFYTMLVGIVDLLIILVVIDVADRFFSKSPSSDDEDEEDEWVPPL